jgi:PAS domain S-box-containing protein
MTAQQVRELASQLDRDIAMLRERAATNPIEQEMIGLLDTTFAELRAASDEVSERSAELDKVATDVEILRRRNAALLEMMGDGAAETDEAGIIRWTSDSLARLFNVRQDYLLGKPILLFVAEEDRKTLHHCLSLLEDGKPVQKCEISFSPRQGPSIKLVVDARQINGAENEPLTILWVVRDASARAKELRGWRSHRDQLEREILDRNAIIKDLDESIGHRLAGIRKLGRRVVELQDLEGHKLARELRERFGQTLGAVKLNLANLGRNHDELVRAPLYREALKLVDAAMQRLREIYFELSPPLAEGVGLVGMIRQMLARLAEPERLKATLEADSLPLLSPQVESAGVWVTREALTNVVRHSGATAVEVTIRREGNRLNLGIRDNGRGFNIPVTRERAERAGCFGLVGMEERVAILGGDIQIVSAPRQGTEIRVMFPAAARS